MKEKKTAAKKMDGAGVWSDYVRLRARYQRSVHLEHDSRSNGALDGYVITPLVHANIKRISRGLELISKARAWSITGPYGSGKSAFALFLSKLYSEAKQPGTITARSLLDKQDATLAKQLFGSASAYLGSDEVLVPVLITGERRPLDVQLLEALKQTTSNFWTGRGTKPDVIKQIDEALQKATSSEIVSAKEIVRLFQGTAEKIRTSSQRGRGLIVVLDEAGKSLEYAASNPLKGDIQLLQELAEAATRSEENTIFFVVLLHQAFERYAGKLSTSQRNEWVKVQGRFEDIPFQESSDQLVRLISASLDVKELPEKHQQESEALAKSFAGLVNSSMFPEQEQFAQLLLQTLPLHPVTALVLGPLFRSRLCQNERSLFAFLASTEPHGFQEFLHNELENSRGVLSLYRIDRLYDYVLSSFGARLYGQQERHWTLVKESMELLPKDAGELDVRIIKAVGILGAFGEGPGFSTSEAILRSALAETEEEADKISSALERLQKSSILVYRKYKNAFQLWEGSDLDIDSLVRAASADIDPRGNIIQRLLALSPPRPIVARKHLFETGTLRVLEVKYASEAEVKNGADALLSQPTTADGVVWLVVADDDNSAGDLKRQLTQQASWLNLQVKPTVLVVPSKVEHLRTLAVDLIALEKVKANTPQLHNDSVARREVTGRLNEVSRLLQEELNKFLGGEVSCSWHYKGNNWFVQNAREMARVISEICDQAYNQAPAIHNELLNRKEISSSAAAARRNLLEAMITKGSEASLGFQGTPAEVSMYLSVLKAHELHHFRDGKWSFGRPIPKEKGSLVPTYDFVLNTLAKQGDSKLKVKTLYSQLALPPFGIKDGVLPVLLISVMVALEGEIAIYEDGAFVPSMSGAMLERLLRSPDKFEIQRVTIIGARAALLEKFSGSLVKMPSGGAVGLLALVRELVRTLNNLPSYSKQTQTLTRRAIAVREALGKSREPGSLVFRELPLACEVEPFEATDSFSEKATTEMLARLKAALSELQQAYHVLLMNIEKRILSTFELQSELSQAREILAERSERLIEKTVDLQLKGFLIRASDQGLQNEEWLISMATLLVGKPPESWFDRDLEQMQLTLGAILKKFRMMESVSLDIQPEKVPESSEMVRVSVFQPGSAEQERVVVVSKKDSDKLSALRQKVKDSLSAMGPVSRDLLLAGLALVAQELMIEGNSSKETTESKKHD